MLPPFSLRLQNSLADLTAQQSVVVGLLQPLPNRSVKKEDKGKENRQVRR